MQDHLIQATAADATVRLIAAVTTDLVNEACPRHRAAPTASAALGRALTGALLLGRTFKDLEYITLRFDCSGPIGGIVAEASAHGTVRGYLKNPAAHLPPNERGKLDVRGVVSAGLLHVIRWMKRRCNRSSNRSSRWSCSRPFANGIQCSWRSICQRHQGDDP